MVLMAVMAIVQGVQPVTFGFVWGSGLAMSLSISCSCRFCANRTYAS